MISGVADYITREDLFAFGKQLAEDIKSELKKEIKTSAEDVKSDIRGEMQLMSAGLYADVRSDMKQLEVRLINHTEDVVGAHSAEILQVIADTMRPRKPNAGNW